MNAGSEVLSAKGNICGQLQRITPKESKGSQSSGSYKTGACAERSRDKRPCSGERPLRSSQFSPRWAFTTRRKWMQSEVSASLFLKCSILIENLRYSEPNGSGDTNELSECCDTKPKINEIKKINGAAFKLSGSQLLGDYCPCFLKCPHILSYSLV